MTMLGKSIYIQGIVKELTAINCELHVNGIVKQLIRQDNVKTVYTAPPPASDSKNEELIKSLRSQLRAKDALIKSLRKQLASNSWEVDDRINALIEANHEANKRIKELEEKGVDEYLKNQINERIHDFQPSRKQCEKAYEELNRMTE